MGKRGSGGDKRQAFFTSVRKEKLDTLRWSLQYGGFNPAATEDDEGHTALQLAAAGNKLKSMQTILDYLRRLKENNVVNIPDDKGRTPMMMAANQGHLGIVKMLIDLTHANVNLKDDDGRTARDHAVMRGKNHIVDYLDNGDESESDEEEEELEEGGKAEYTGPKKGMVGMSTRALKARGLIGATKAEDETATTKDEERKSEDTPRPVWNEVAECLESEKVDARLGKSACELNIIRLEADSCEPNFIDPALWHCKLVNNLSITLPKGILMELPSSISKLTSLITLKMISNSLVTLPESIGNLRGLKNLNLHSNNLEALPESLSDLNSLETLDVSQNELTSLTSLHGCTNLVSLHADSNKLEVLDLPYNELSRMQELSASSNLIHTLSEDIGSLKALENLNLSNNAINNVPTSLGGCKKKLKSLNLTENPIKDPRVKKMSVKAAAEGARSLKEFLAYLEKNAKKGKKGKKK